MLKSEILDYRNVAFKEQGQFCKNNFGIFKILEDPFLSEHFSNIFLEQPLAR